MEFDKSRVYTALNADELREGDKVIVANTMAELKRIITGEIYCIAHIMRVNDEDCENRFCIGESNATGNITYPLAYLVERAENCTNCGEGKKDGDYWLGCTPDKFGKEEQAKCWHCDFWEPKTEQKDEKKCEDCTIDEICVEGKKIYKDAPCPYHRAKPHYRPFKDTDELIKTWIAKRMITYPDLCLPHIWVRQKECSKGGLLITYFGEDEVKTDMGFMTMSKLLSDYTFTDGSPCGVEE